MDIYLSVHKISASLFLLIYLIKGVAIFSKNQTYKENLFSKMKWLEIPVSFVFLATGIYLLFQMGDTPGYLYIKLLLVLAAIPLAIVGQKRNKPIFLWLSIFVIVYVFGASETRSLSFQKPRIELLADDGTGANFELLNLGSHIYGENCIRCHGRSGDLERYGARKLIGSTLSPEKRRKLIMEGKGNMPGFAKKLDQKELEALEYFLDRYYLQ